MKLPDADVMSGKAVRIALLLAVFSGIILYALVDPAEVSIFPKCPFYMLTGLKCPGCGSQRALHQLLNLHIGEAFRYNALMVLIIPLLVYLTVADLFRRRYPGLYVSSRNPVLSWSVLAAVLFWWVLRNVLGI